jgi:hypothetical protein
MKDMLAAQRQLADARAVTIDGVLSWPDYNAVYVRVDVMHEGWVRFASAEGKHLYRQVELRQWVLSDKFSPPGGGDVASILAANGLLPVGEKEWRIVLSNQGGKRKSQLLRVTLLNTEAEVAERQERLRLAKESKMARNHNFGVDQYAGEEFTDMFHGTNSRAAQLIVRSQRFEPSKTGMLGKGVYITSSREKAETYRDYHPNAKAVGGKSRNDPLPNGAPDIGCVLKFRARMGVCKTLAVGDPLMRCWHDAEVEEEILSRSRAAKRAAATANAKFAEDLELARPYAQRFLSVVDRQLTQKDDAEALQLRFVYNSAFSAGCPCTPRCNKGMNSCPKANGVLEEWCIYNSDRIDRIEIIEGPGRGDGPQYWDMDVDARNKALVAAADDGWFDNMDLADIERMVTEATQASVAKKLACVYANDPAVTSLRLSSSQLTDEHVLQVLAALEGNAHVKNVDLGNNPELTDSSAAAIRDFIQHRSSAVQSVDLSGNPQLSAALIAEVTAACVASRLARVRANDPAVARLRLSSSQLTDEHVLQVLAALKGNVHVKHVDLGNNPELTDSSAAAIRDFIRCRSSAVQSVDLSGNPQLSAALIAEVAAALRANQRRRWLLLLLLLLLCCGVWSAHLAEISSMFMFGMGCMTAWVCWRCGSLLLTLWWVVESVHPCCACTLWWVLRVYAVVGGGIGIRVWPRLWWVVESAAWW